MRPVLHTFRKKTAIKYCLALQETSEPSEFYFVRRRWPWWEVAVSGVKPAATVPPGVWL